MIREMQIRNYSERTIKTYVASIEKLAVFFNHPPDQISTEQFKDFLYHRIHDDNVSVCVINQSISAFKILKTDVPGFDWEQIRIKRPKKAKKLPCMLYREKECPDYEYAPANYPHRKTASFNLFYQSSFSCFV